MTVTDVFRQFVENAIKNTTYTSSAGDSPKINRALDVNVNPEDFEALIENSIRDVVYDVQTEVAGGRVRTTEDKTDKGFGAMDALRAGRSGMGGIDAAGVMLQLMPQLIPIMIATGAAAALFEWAKGAGGPIDTRYRRDLLNEQFNFLSRQLARDTEIGNRQLIVQSDANFKNIGGAGNSNTLRTIRERGDRLAPVGLLVEDRAKGLERLS